MHLQPPILTQENLPDLIGGQSEVVLSVLDSAGAELESFGFPVPGRRYVDFGDPESEEIRGGPRPIRRDQHDIRALRIPWSERGSSLAFDRSDVVATASGLEIRRVPLLRLSSRPDQGPQVRAVRDDVPMPRIVPIPWAPPWERKPRPLPWSGQEPFGADGQFVDATTPISNGAPADRFDIVITGDGFQPGELGRFDQLADQLMTGLRAMEPFSSMASLINWHVVRVASTDSGIERCPTPQPSNPTKRTFYRVEGCWDNSGYPGFFGTDHPERIHWAAEQVAPWEHVELVIVIANCSTWGGHAWPDWKLAIVSTHANLFVGLAAHECGHVISSLAEEYIACVKDEPQWLDPNKTRMPKVGRSLMRHVGAGANAGVVLQGGPPIRDTVWWKGLARAGELHPDGTFKAVHVRGDAVSPTDGMSPAVPPLQAGFIGAYWGCQDIAGPEVLLSLISRLSRVPAERLQVVIDILRALMGLNIPADPNECNAFWDQRGGYYFRAAATCRMRYPSYTFCRVCQHLISNSIRNASGVALVEPLP
jgi:hypothetical protein